FAPGFPAFRPASNARNVDLIDGSSTPPTMPAFAVFDIRPAARPHRYAACSSSKTIGARLGAVFEPEVVTKTVFGYSLATRAAAREAGRREEQERSERAPRVRLPHPEYHATSPMHLSRSKGRPSGAVLPLGLAAGFVLHVLLAGRVPGGIDVDTASEALRALRLVLLPRFEVLTFSHGPSCATLYLYLLGLSLRAL